MPFLQSRGLLIAGYHPSSQDASDTEFPPVACEKKKYFIKHPEFHSCLGLIMSFASQDDSEILKYAKIL